MSSSARPPEPRRRRPRRRPQLHNETMPPALWTLIRLQFRGRLRRMVHGVGTPRGMTFLVLGIVMFLGWIGPMVYRATHLPRVDPRVVRNGAPFAILAFCIGNLFGSVG